jgi:hypothetical protein
VDFVFRGWADFQFLIVALRRLRHAAELATRVSSVRVLVEDAIREFDQALPGLRKMRNVGEHIDAFAVDKGRDRTVSRLQLQVGQMNQKTIHWLGEQLDTDVALDAAQKLFDAIRAAIVQFNANKGDQRSRSADTDRSRTQ